MRFVVRTACRADIPAMHALRLRARENRLADPSRIGEGDYLAYVDAATAWVGAAQSRIVGFAALDASAGSVWALFVAPEAEGTGIGRALHAALLAEARRRGLAALRLSTEGATRAELFYAGLGWRKDGRNAEGETVFAMDLRG